MARQPVRAAETAGELEQLRERNALLERELNRARRLLQESDADRRAHIAELHEANLRLRQLAEHVEEVFWLYDAVNECNLYVSPAWERVWQRPLSDVNEWAATIHEDDRDRIVTTTRSLTLSDSFDVTYRIRRPDDTIRWIRDRGFPIADEDGRMYRLAGVAEDITLRKRTQDSILRARDELERRVEERTADLVRVNEQLRQEITDRRAAKRTIRQLEHEIAHATRLSTVGEMTASLAHELNQPLNAIVQYGGACLQTLRRAGTTEQLGELVEDMIAQSLRAGEIIRRLRAFTQKRDFHRAPVDVAEALVEILPVLRVDARNWDVRFEEFVSGQLPKIVADRVQVQQVVVNLVRNAIEATSEAGTTEPVVRVELTGAGDGYVRLAVSDNGPGFVVERPEAAFEPFYSTKEDGMGLGLSIVKSIAEAHEGRISAENRPEGGAVVALELPVSRRR